MISVQVRRGVCGTSAQFGSFVRQGRRLGLLRLDDRQFGDYDKQNEIIEGLRDELADVGGQCLSLDLAGFMEKPFAETFFLELESICTGYRQRADFPLTRKPSPFIDRAITWQRLCDRVIEDENPRRPTLLVVENFDQADERTRCDVERLIRFHEMHNIRRTFLLTLPDDEAETLRPSLQRLIGLQITI